MTFWSNTFVAALAVVLLVSVGGTAPAQEAQVPAETARRVAPVGL